MIETILVGVCTSLLGFLSAYVLIRRTMRTENIYRIFAEIFDEIPHDEQTAKNIYLVGGLFGQGLKKGIGLTKKGGKHGLDDILADLLGAFAEKAIGGLFSGGSSTTPTTQPPINPNMNPTEIT